MHPSSFLHSILSHYRVAELLISRELQDGILQQPISRAGYIEIRRILDGACIAFEALLAAEAS